MKRLFFLFAFIFIGFGAFGQVDNSDLLIEKKTPKLEKDWYVSTAYYGKFGLGNIFLRDRHLSDIPQRGYGFRVSVLDFGYTGEQIQASLGVLTDIGFMFTHPTIINQSTRPDAKKFWYGEANFLNANFAFRVAKTGHYIGGHFNGSNMVLSSDGLFIPSNDVQIYDSGDFFFSTGLEYTSHFNIKNVPIRVNATLPIVAFQIPGKEGINAKNWEGVGIKNYFKPTISIDFFPRLTKRYHSFKISYVCSYANFDRKLGEYYQHRSLTNMIMISTFSAYDYDVTFGQFISGFFRD